MQPIRDLWTEKGILLAPIAIALMLAASAQAKGPGELEFDESSFEVIEEAGVAMITVERSGGEDGVVTVDYHTAAATATEGADYGDVAGTLTWPDGDGSDRVFTVPIFDDGEPEGAESIQLVLSNPTGGATLDGQGSVSTLVIGASDGGSGEDSDSADDGEDSDSADDGEDSDSADDGEDSDSADEGEDSDSGGDGEDSDSGDDGTGSGGQAGIFKFDEESFEVLESAGVAMVVVERSRGEAGEVSVGYSTGDGSAVGGEDYTGVSGTLTWFSGDGVAKTFVVPLLDDSLSEGDETIELTLHDPTGGATLDPLRQTSVIRILANDGGSGGDDGGGGGGGGGGGDGGKAGLLKFSSRTFQTLEGSVAAVTVERSMGETGAVSVDYMTFDGSAFDGADYTGVSGTLTWAAGDSGNKTFMVPTADDAESEGNETFELQLMNPTGGAELDAQRDSAILTIVDDDSASCTPSDQTLCLLGGRFRVQVAWRTAEDAAGPGRPISLSDESGLVWFFNPENVEMLVKVLDGCSFSGTYWVYFAATTNLDLEVEVTDTLNGQSKTYRNPLGRAAEPVQDVTTFTGCP